MKPEVEQIRQLYQSQLADASRLNKKLVDATLERDALKAQLADAVGTLREAAAYIDRVNRDEGWWDESGDGERIHADCLKRLGVTGDKRE